MNVIETQRLTLRKPGAQDIAALIDFYVSERSAMAGGYVSFSEAVTRAYSIFGHWVHRGYGLFTITRRGDDTALGIAGPYYPPGRPETEIGWVLFADAEGQGYATEAAKATISFSRDALGWSDIVHYINPENLPSIAVAERLGAQLDTNAQQPKPDQLCLVYRQPRVDIT